MLKKSLKDTRSLNTINATDFTPNHPFCLRHSFTVRQEVGLGYTIIRTENQNVAGVGD